MNLNASLRGHSRGWVFAEAMGMLLVIGYFDYLLPFEVTLLMFYFVPILFTAWFGNRRMTLAMAVMSSVTWWLANLNLQPYPMNAYLWAGCNRLATFLVVALGAVAMRRQRETMQARLAALERTRELEEEILRISEREKMRLGQDIHDGLCQQLAAIDCAVACLRHDLEEKDWPEAASVSFIQQQLSSAISQAREMARGVFPVQIEEDGFLAALEELVEAMNRLKQISVTLLVHGEVKIRDPEIGMHLFRFAQEALGNVTKHAQARHVEIDIDHDDDRLSLRIADDGIGLASAPPNQKGIGLQTMNYRIKAMGGELQITPGPEKGTVVRGTIPLACPLRPSYACAN